MDLNRPRRPGERAFAVIAVVFALAASWQAHGISGFTGLSTPGVFPMLAAGIMTLAALSILWSTWKLPAPEEGEGRGPGAFLREVLPSRQRVMILLLVAYLWVLPWAGFVIASSLFLLVAIQYLWRKRIWVSVALTAAIMLAVYVVFRVVFQVVLPQGMLVRGVF